MATADIVGRAPAVQSRQPLRVLAILAATLAYGAVVAMAVSRGWPHYELLAIVLQVALLLPALVYGLKTPGGIASGTLPARPGIWTAAAIGVFLIASAALSAINVQGVSIPDERAYLFQARILASGNLMATAPPGSPEHPWDAPPALNFNHHVISKQGWFAKYPLGWPLMLALPEKLGLGWLVNPLLAAGILICTAGIAYQLCGGAGAFWAVAMLVLSPCFLAQTVILMSHAMAGLLVAAACWAWLNGTRRRKLRYFALMYVLVGLTFHVRPFTALLTALTLTVALVFSLRHERGFLSRILLIGAAAGAVTVGSVLLYNQTFTGDFRLSPYALQRGLSVPLEISASLPRVLGNMKAMWRSAFQSTLLYFFPLIFVPAAIGFWKNRKTFPVVWLLLSLFVVIVLGHLVQTESSGSTIAERYWFEGYFAIAILAAQGIVEIRPGRQALIAASCGLLAAQAMVTVAASQIILRNSAPSIAVAHLAAELRDCRCVIFLKASPPVFFGQHLNLNGPAWAQANAFYAVDPGEDQRAEWTRTLGRERWVVVTYDQSRGIARQEP
jgi:hypothetical protein